MHAKSDVVDKIRSLEDLGIELETVRSSGKKIVHCHGVFDLLHLGHIRYFEEAAEQGDVVVVTLTSDRFINKGPGRPEFTGELRAEMVASIGIVDHVAINDAATAVTAIDAIKPSVYVKGPDYKDQSDDRSGGIVDEQAAVESHGGRLHITSGVTHSSTKLLNSHFDRLPRTTRVFLDGLKREYPADTIVDYLDRAAGLSVLVIGDTIIDEYQYCSAIGKSSKGPNLAVRLESAELSLGGSMAVANHMANFASKVTVVSAVGDDDYGNGFITGKLNPDIESHHLRMTGRRTIVKRRLIERYFFQKLLEVYEIDDEPPSDQDEKRLVELIEKIAPQVDVVVIADFGHDLITPAIARAAEQHAKYLALNVQMNAGNNGFNTISKYKRADYISITEAELRLDFRDKRENLDVLVEKTMKRFGASRITVTQGSDGCTVYSSDSDSVKVPAVAMEIVDRVGAGDAVLAVTSLVSALDAPPPIIGIVGNIVGAQAVGVVSNVSSVQRLPVIRSIESLLK